MQRSRCRKWHEGVTGFFSKNDENVEYWRRTMGGYDDVWRRNTPNKSRNFSDKFDID